MPELPTFAPNKIILHCSDSDYGDVDVIDQWHKARGWDGIGYHYVITNGHAKESARPYTPAHDGVIQAGRPIEKQGVHCYGQNDDSIGVVLIGRHHFTARQLYIALPDLLYRLCKEHDIPAKNIYPHSLYNKKKTCPNIPPAPFQVVIDMVKAKLNSQ